MTEPKQIRPDAKKEDIEALMDLNRAEAEALQEGIRKKLGEGDKLAQTAASLHGDQHLTGVFDEQKKEKK